MFWAVLLNIEMWGGFLHEIKVQTEEKICFPLGKVLVKQKKKKKKKKKTERHI